MRRNIAVLPGDGIGPEVTREAVKVLRSTGNSYEFEEALIGGAAYDDGGHPLPEASLDLCRKADAVLLGAVGGPKYDNIQPPELRPEVGALLRLRAELNLYANVRPAKTLTPLLKASPLKAGRGTLVDLVVIRELTGGIYFAKPRERRDNGNTAVDTCIYHRYEIERIAHRAFQIARLRRREIVSVDKANVLETSRLWREVVTEMANDNPDVSVKHMLVDNCAMQLVREPAQFDVILTENMFGDILSDLGAALIGGMGMAPSADIGDNHAIFQPCHGTGPDIAGKGLANPTAMLLSGAMMLEWLGDRHDNAGCRAAADALVRAVETAFAPGDLVSTEAGGTAGTEEIVARVAVALEQQKARVSA